MDSALNRPLSLSTRRPRLPRPLAASLGSRPLRLPVLCSKTASWPQGRKRGGPSPQRLQRRLQEQQQDGEGDQRPARPAGKAPPSSLPKQAGAELKAVQRKPPPPQPLSLQLSLEAQGPRLLELSLGRVRALFRIRAAQTPEEVLAVVRWALDSHQAAGSVFTAALERLEELHRAAAAAQAGVRAARGGGGGRPQHPRGAPAASPALMRAFGTVLTHAVERLHQSDPWVASAAARAAAALRYRVPAEQQMLLAAVLVGQIKRVGVPGHALAGFISATFGAWPLGDEEHEALLRGVLAKDGTLTQRDLCDVLAGLCRLRARRGVGRILPLQQRGAWDVVRLAEARAGHAGPQACRDAILCMAATGYVPEEGSLQSLLEGLLRGVRRNPGRHAAAVPAALKGIARICYEAGDMDKYAALLRGPLVAELCMLAAAAGGAGTTADSSGSSGEEGAEAAGGRGGARRSSASKTILPELIESCGVLGIDPACGPGGAALFDSVLLPQLAAGLGAGGGGGGARGAPLRKQGAAGMLVGLAARYGQPGAGGEGLHPALQPFRSQIAVLARSILEEVPPALLEGGAGGRGPPLSAKHTQAVLSGFAAVCVEEGVGWPAAGAGPVAGHKPPTKE